MATTTAPLLASLADSPHDFLQPSLPLYTDTLAYLKQALDPLAADVSAAQQERQREERKKRKRGQNYDDEKILRLKQIHVEGFGPEQVWEQARRVINAAREEAERGFSEAQARQLEADGELESDVDSEDMGEEGVDYEVEGIDDGSEVYEGEDGESEEDDLDDTLEDGEDIEMEDDFDDEDAMGNGEPAEEFVEDKFGLNDGFFSIDDFNKQSEFLEQQDARGDDDGAASDEEEVDWNADPRGQAALDAAAGAGEEDDMDDDDDDEDGPTFGDPDALSEDDDDEEMDGGEMDVMGGMANTNEIMYAEFFAPPAQKKRKNKKGRPNPHNFPAAAEKKPAEDEDDMERTMAAVHRDLFEDEDSEGEDEDAEDQEELDPSDPRSRRSAHERRKAALAEEIRKLEAANVAKREWTLQGEARAADRPMNSLLEEDLDFERAGKPVPVITTEISEDIESLIKRRILAHEFQDIIRRRPDDLATGKSRRGQLDFDLDDKQNRKGLADEYEEEHLRRTDPNFVDAKDEKTKKEEQEIEALWNKIRTDLDGLSSWNFRPKAPAPQIDIRVDAPVITMEDARPSAGGDVAGASQLAPQEVYRGGEASNVKEEAVGKSGLPSAREELTREEKKRRRRREKERIRKASSNDPAKPESKDKQSKKEMLGDLKKGGVKVLSKKGEIRDVEGNKIKSGSGGQDGAGRFKL